MKSKWFNYLLFIAVGLICVEFLSMSQPTTLIFPLNYIGYGFVYILILNIIIKYDLRDFKSHYLLGIFVSVLTETFITKVLWNVPWREVGEPLGFRFLGFGVLDSLMLTFFWHPVMAVAVPIMICNYLFGFPNPKAEVKRSTVRGILFILPLILALYNSFQENLTIAYVGMIANFVMLTIYIFLFMKFSEEKVKITYVSTIITSVLLVALLWSSYFGIVDYYPNNQTLGITFGFIGLLTVINIFNVFRSKIDEKGTLQKKHFTWKNYLLYCGYFVVSYSLIRLVFLIIPQIGIILFFLSWGLAILLGTIYFLRKSIFAFTGK